MNDERMLEGLRYCDSESMLPDGKWLRVTMVALVLLHVNVTSYRAIK